MTCKVMYGISVAMLLVAVALVYLNFHDVRHPLIVHFDRYRGIDFVGSVGMVYGIIVFGGVVNMVHLVISAALKRRSVVLASTWAAAGLFISLLILIAVGVIVSIN